MKVAIKNKFLLIFSILESFWFIYGNLLSNDLSIRNFNIKCFILFIIGIIIIFTFNLIIKKLINKEVNSATFYNFSWKKVFIYSLILFILWLPILLAYYPGIWGYDIGSQVPHINDKYSSFRHISSQHPITHTLYIELFVLIGKALNNYDIGILLATIVQMIVISISLSYCIEKVKSYFNYKKVIKIFTIFSLLFYGLMPFSSSMAISHTKDVFFTAFFIISFIHLYDLLNDNYINYSKKIIYFLIFSFLSCLFKNNYFAIFIILLIILIIYLKKNVKVKKILVKYGICTILIFYSINFIYNIILVPEKIDVWEAFSSQVTTICYTTKNHPKVINEYTKDGLLFDVLKVDFIPDSECYSFNADNMKSFFMEFTIDNPNLFKFMINWIKIGIKYPIEYLDSFSNLNRGAWYILDESYANIYPNLDTANGYLSTKYVENLKEKPKSKFKWLYNKLELILTDNIYQQNVFFKIILSPCLYILIILYFFFLYLDVKDKKNIILFIPLICLYVNLVTGPCIVVRYVYTFMMLAPILIVLHKKRDV